MHEHDVPFYKPQQPRDPVRTNGLIDPTSIDDYIAVGGYGALAKALCEMTPERGRRRGQAIAGCAAAAAAAFPPGASGRAAAAPTATPKYVICNADEGDPGAFMDRAVMEGNPHCVLEGMIIGAYAIGASEGYIYVRNEYPLAVKNASHRHRRRREATGLLGENILGSGFDFDIADQPGRRGVRLRRVDGADGLARGRRGRAPGQVRPHRREGPVGQADQRSTTSRPGPTCRSSSARAPSGSPASAREGSKGTKVFSLVGKVKNTGLVEVPMGITLREIIFDIGGGIPRRQDSSRPCRPAARSGGCIPDEHCSTCRSTSTRSTKAGSMMGSGGMIVMDEDTCMVDVRPVLPRLPAGGVLRQVRPLPRGDCPQPGDPGAHLRGQGPARGPRPARGDDRRRSWASPLCPGPDGAQPGAVHPQVLPRRVRSAHPRAALPGRRVQAPDRLPDRPRQVHRLHSLREGLPPQQAIAGEKKAPHVLDRSHCIKCGACCHDVCRFEAIIIRSGEAQPVASPSPVAEAN